jgi:hypothetical protein
MGIARSTFYDAPASAADDTEILAKIAVICDEFESYGYRRVGAALRHQGIIVNSKKAGGHSSALGYRRLVGACTRPLGTDGSRLPRCPSRTA